MRGGGRGLKRQTDRRQTAREMTRTGSRDTLNTVFAVPCRTFNLSIKHILLSLPVVCRSLSRGGRGGGGLDGMARRGGEESG